MMTIIIFPQDRAWDLVNWQYNPYTENNGYLPQCKVQASYRWCEYRS